MSENTSLKEAIRYEKNPFHKELLVDLKPVKKRQYVNTEGNKGVQNIIVNPNTSEVVGESRFFTYKVLDKEQFTKLFISRNAAFWDMPPTATRVFAYIMKLLKPNEDSFYFDVTDCEKESGYKSTKSVQLGVNWLVTNNFIAKTTRINVYFINPTIFFNGDRISYIETIVREERIDPNQIDAFRNLISK